MNFKKVAKMSFFTFCVMWYISALLASQEENNDQDIAMQDENALVSQEDGDAQVIQIDDQSQENAEQEVNQFVKEEQIRDAFFGLLTFIELIHDAEKVGQELDRFFYIYNANPMTKIRDFAGVDSPKISLLRLATHAARLDGQEGKFTLVQEMLKRGGNPFIIEEGERYSLAQENALCAVQLCHCDQTGYLEIYDYEAASPKVKTKARKRHGALCKNAKRLQDMFEEYEPESNCSLKA